MIKSKEVRTFTDLLICDNCGVPMKFIGETLYCYPPLYNHECPICHKVEEVSEVYPNVRYVEIEEGEEVDK